MGVLSKRLPSKLIPCQPCKHNHCVQHSQQPIPQRLLSGLLLSAIAVGGLTMTMTTTASAKNIQAQTADYRFSVDGHNGTATRSLTQSGNTYKYAVSARVAGVATASENTTFTLSGSNVVPSSASTSYRIFGVGRTHSINYRPASKQAVSTYRGKSTTLAMPRQAYDDLSLEVQIRQELLNGRFSGRYDMVKKDGSIQSTPFRRAGNAKVTVPAGTYDTVRVDRVHDDSSRSTSFWLAPSLNYLPVKVTQVNDGKTMQLELSKVR